MAPPAFPPEPRRAPAFEPIVVDVAEPYRARPLRPRVQQVARLGLWAVIALGAVGGVAAWVREPAQPAAPAAPPAESEAAVPAPVAGTAEVVVEEWLTPTPDDRDRLAALFVDPPGAGVGADEGLSVGRVATVAGRRMADDYWAVTVAAVVTEERLPEGEGQTDDVGYATSTWYLEVALVGDPATGLAALTIPSVVGPPSGAAAEGWAATTEAPAAPDEDDPLADLAAGFLDALLVGGGDVSRYLAPGLEAAPLDPAPFTAVELTDLVADDLGTGEVRALAYVRATTPGGTVREFSYEIVAVRRDGRWEVGRFSGAPTLVLPPGPEAGEGSGEEGDRSMTGG